LQFFVGLTDHDWFDYLSRLDGLDEANFWQPSGSVQFRALQPGEPFLFKLHSPKNYIVGGVFFSPFTILPASIVWKAFGEKNGARTEEEMRARVARYRRIANPKRPDDFNIGCILLESPSSLNEQTGFPCQIGNAKSFVDTGCDSEGDGAGIWERVELLIRARQVFEEEGVQVTDSGPRYGEPTTVLPRLGQGSFSTHRHRLL
jgi:putative restriction endonuclease